MKAKHKDNSSKRVTGRYSSVEAMLISMPSSARIIRRVKKLLERDKGVTFAFRNGTSIKQLSQKCSLSQSEIEDILRYELTLQNKSKST